MAVSGSTAVAHFALTASALWALCHNPEFSFASVGFALYFLTGILGILSYGASRMNSETYSRRLQKTYAKLLNGIYLFSIPLFIYHFIRFIEYTSFLSFIIPIYELYSAMFNRKRIDKKLMNIVHGIALADFNAWSCEACGVHKCVFIFISSSFVRLLILPMIHLPEKHLILVSLLVVDIVCILLITYLKFDATLN